MWYDVKKREVRPMPNVLRIGCGTVNCYLISRGRDAVLVDTGGIRHRQKILDACNPFHMRLLVLTHGHVDHVQNTAFLADALQIPVAMHADDIGLLSDQFSQPLAARGVFGRVMRALSLRSFRTEPLPQFTPDILLRDGDLLDGYGIPARILGLPGHTRGSIGLDIMGRDLIVGDALMHLGPPAPAPLYYDRTQLLQSARVITALGARRVYFGHGLPTNNRNWVRSA